jgi:N-acetylmuramic acid 6-phosphate (MurNAc-6-P) etherase
MRKLCRRAGQLSPGTILVCPGHLRQLHPDVINNVVDKALNKFKASQMELKERRHYLYKQIKDVDIEIERLVAAISAGGDIPVLVTAVKAANERKAPF